jgi:hypothetical protein
MNVRSDAVCVTTMWGLDGTVSKRRKFKNPEAVKREAERIGAGTDGAHHARGLRSAHYGATMDRVCLPGQCANVTAFE